MRTLLRAPALLGLLLVGACDSLGVTDPNDPGLETLSENPTRSAVANAATGLLIGTRTGIFEQNGFVSLLGVMGRESYNFDPADPRFVTEMLIGPLDGGSPAFGGNFFGDSYANIRNANIVLNALEVVPGMTDAEKEATRGFAKTIQALDFLNVIVTRNDNGAPIDVDRDPTAEPAPIATKAEVYAHIVALLNEAKAHLEAGGAEFPFQLSSGFAGFDTPMTFLRFNRALQARVSVYMGDFAGALTALGESFLDTGAPFSLGVFHVFSTTAGDQTNPLYDPDARALYAHPSILTGAQLQPGGAKDLRATSKVEAVASKTVQGITATERPTVYGSTTDPIPIIRNEELILLRAEANIGLNNLPAAVPDINLVRANAGGLAPILAFASQAEALDELLYNRRYSLYFEGGHSWIDAQRYGRLSGLPLDLPEHRRFQKFPFPINECLARPAQPPTGCSPEPGI